MNSFIDYKICFLLHFRLWAGRPVKCSVLGNLIRDWDFCLSPRSAYKIARLWHSPSVPVPAIFYGQCCESPVKSTHEVGDFIR